MWDTLKLQPFVRVQVEPGVFIDVRTKLENEDWTGWIFTSKFDRWAFGIRDPKFYSVPAKPNIFIVPSGFWILEAQFERFPSYSFPRFIIVTQGVRIGNPP